jgi:hypothetical protein
MMIVWWIVAIGNLIAIVILGWFDVVVAHELGTTPSWLDFALLALMFAGVLRLHPVAKRWDAMARR